MAGLLRPDANLAERLSPGALRPAVRSSHLIDGTADIDPAWFQSGMRIGVTPGASAPESRVQQVIERLRALGVRAVHELHETTSSCRPSSRRER